MPEVFVNIYDLHYINPHIRFLGLGFYHTGIQVSGWEYTFAATPQGNSGIFKVEPKTNTPGFRESVRLGHCQRNSVEAAIRKLTPTYQGREYNLILKNCNHFSQAFARELVGRSIPDYINRAARIGRFFCCHKLMRRQNEGQQRNGKTSISTRVSLFSGRGMKMQELAEDQI